MVSERRTIIPKPSENTCCFEQQNAHLSTATQKYYIDSVVLSSPPRFGKSKPQISLSIYFQRKRTDSTGQTNESNEERSEERSEREQERSERNHRVLRHMLNGHLKLSKQEHSERKHDPITLKKTRTETWNVLKMIVPNRSVKRNASRHPERERT